MRARMFCPFPGLYDSPKYETPRSLNVISLSLLLLVFNNTVVSFTAKADRSHRIKTYMLVTSYQGFRVRIFL